MLMSFVQQMRWKWPRSENLVCTLPSLVGNREPSGLGSGPALVSYVLTDLEHVGDSKSPGPCGSASFGPAAEMSKGRVSRRPRLLMASITPLHHNLLMSLVKWGWGCLESLCA